MSIAHTMSMARIKLPEKNRKKSKKNKRYLDENFAVHASHQQMLVLRPLEVRLTVHRVRARTVRKGERKMKIRINWQI